MGLFGNKKKQVEITGEALSEIISELKRIGDVLERDERARKEFEELKAAASNAVVVLDKTQVEIDKIAAPGVSPKRKKPVGG